MSRWFGRVLLVDPLPATASASGSELILCLAVIDEWWHPFRFWEFIRQQQTGTAVAADSKQNTATAAVAATSTGSTTAASTTSGWRVFLDAAIRMPAAAAADSHSRDGAWSIARYSAPAGATTASASGSTGSGGSDAVTGRFSDTLTLDVTSIVIPNNTSGADGRSTRIVTAASDDSFRVKIKFTASSRPLTGITLQFAVRVLPPTVVSVSKVEPLPLPLTILPAVSSPLALIATPPAATGTTATSATASATAATATAVTPASKPITILSAGAELFSDSARTSVVHVPIAGSAGGGVDITQFRGDDDHGIVDLGSRVWDGALALYHYIVHSDSILHSQKHASSVVSEWSAASLLSGRSVVELGSGTGFLGLACTRTVTPPPVKMWITDLKEMVPLIQHNIALNSRDVPPSKGAAATAAAAATVAGGADAKSPPATATAPAAAPSVIGCELAWGCTDLSPFSPPVDTIIVCCARAAGVCVAACLTFVPSWWQASDVAYEIGALRSLLHTLYHITRCPQSTVAGSRILLAGKQRSGLSEFIALAAILFDVTLLVPAGVIGTNIPIYGLTKKRDTSASTSTSDATAVPFARLDEHLSHLAAQKAAAMRQLAGAADAAAGRDDLDALFGPND